MSRVLLQLLGGLRGIDKRTKSKIIVAHMSSFAELDAAAAVTTGTQLGRTEHCQGSDWASHQEILSKQTCHKHALTMNRNFSSLRDGGSACVCTMGAASYLDDPGEA